MNQTWNDIQWIFEPDGSYRDIYVQEVSIREWESLIDLLNDNYKIAFGIIGEEGFSNKIDKENSIKFLTDETGEMECKIASIIIDKININCHFFLVDQIEFDIDPKEINSIEDFEKVEALMLDISKTLNKQVTLTEENTPEFPLIKIDFNRGINRILTKNEAQKYIKEQNSLSSRIRTLMTKFQMKFFPEKFKDNILRNANKPYTSTKKNKNVW